MNNKITITLTVSLIALILVSACSASVINNNKIISGKNEDHPRLKKEAEIIKTTAAKTRALSNHLMIETSALGTVGLILPVGDPDRASFLSQASQWTDYIIGNAPLDGSWGEGVQYWQYGLGYFLRFLEGAQTSGYHDYFKDYSWLRKTGKFPIHFSDRLKCNERSNFTWSLQANEIAEITKLSSGYEVMKDKATLSVYPLRPAGLASEVTERTLRGSDVHGDPEYDESEALLRTIKLNATGSEINYLVVLAVNKPGEIRPEVSIGNGAIRIVKNRREFQIKYQPEKALSEKILEMEVP